MKTKLLTFVALLVLFLSGCANFNSVHRNFNISNGNGALIDIKQRAIIASVVKTKNGDVETTETRVCAEPSPDSLSAYAAELAAKADNGQAAAGFSAAFQESAAFVGLRTQSIQLLRDASYRLCESYLNGAIEKEEYSWLLRRFQRNMLVLLAVEQLTGTVRVPAVTIGTEGAASTGRTLTELRAEQDKIDAKIKQFVEDNKKLEADTNPANTDKNKATMATNNEAIASLKADRKAIEDAISNTRDLLASGRSTVSAYNIAPQLTEKSDTQISIVAGAVQAMVENLINQDDRAVLCFNYLKSKNTTSLANDSLASSCLKYIESGVGAREEELKPLAKKREKSANQQPSRSKK